MQHILQLIWLIVGIATAIAGDRIAIHVPYWIVVSNLTYASLWNEIQSNVYHDGSMKYLILMIQNKKMLKEYTHLQRSLETKIKICANSTKSVRFCIL